MFSIQILTHRNLEAFKKLEENTSNSKVFNNINENYFFSEESPKSKPKLKEQVSPKTMSKQIYMEETISSIKNKEIFQLPFIMIEFQDPNDVY